MTHTKKYRVHYAWVILVAACVLSIVSRADSASFAVFVDPLVAQFGWKRGDISFAYALAFLAGLPAVVLMGWLGDRYGARTLMIGASFLISTGTVLLGTIKELWQFYVFYGLFVGSLGNAAFTVLLPVIVTRWFHRHMGLAVGIYWAALGAGPMIFAPLFRWLIETRGWEQSFTFIGVVLGAILLVFSSLIRSSPREKGLSAYGAEGSAREQRVSAASAVTPGALREVLSQRPVWFLMGIHHLGCAGHAIILAHVVSMATFRGVSGIEAAGVLSTIAGVSVISRFASAILTERFGGRAVLTMAMIGQSTSILILLFANEAWVFYLFAVVFGLCYGGEMVGFPIINRQLFGERAPLSSIYSFQMVGASTGMALGGWLGGALFDASGAYTSAILASAVIGYLGLPLALALPRHRKSFVSRTEAVGTA
jgi:MFS transporter, OFA family, oxalate/formate antiporter